MKTLGSMAIVGMLLAAWQGAAQDAKTKHPSMAPLEQYLMDPAAEILSRGVRPRNLFLAVRRSSSLLATVTKQRPKVQMV
jgi:hypothetical protein